MFIDLFTTNFVKIIYMWEKGNIRTPRMWFEQEYLFEQIFKRKPKVWTLEKIHDLWLRTSNRKERRLNKTRKLWKDIIADMGNSKKEAFSIYHENENGETYEYNFSCSNLTDDYGCSSGLVKFSDDINKAREEQIDFLLANEKAYEWGDLYKKDASEKQRFHYVVESIFFRMIEEKLMSHFKNSDVRPKETFRISIGGKEYYIKASGDGLYTKKYYVKYEFAGAVENNPLEL